MKYYHDVGINFSQEQAHHFNVASRPGVHDHLEKGKSRNLYVLQTKKNHCMLLSFFMVGPKLALKK